MKIFVIAGEPSGDLHASNVVTQLKKEKSIHVEGWGGDHMIASGVDVKVHLRDLAVMGISDVLLKLAFFFSLLRKCKNHISSFHPDLILLVDYSGFNLKIAKWAKLMGFAVHYYIAPKTWAWRPGRNKLIADCVDQLYCIFPFEEKYFNSKGVNAKYVGNPLTRIKERHQLKTQKEIVVLPGSRKQELKAILPVIRELVHSNTSFKWTISKVPYIPIQFYEKFLYGLDSIKITESPSNQLLSSCDFALITSGTATLEAAIIECPQIVMYKTSFINYFLAKFLIRTEYIALPNIILNAHVVDEKIQNDLTVKHLHQSIQSMQSPDRIKKIKENYRLIKRHLGDQNPAITVADSIIKSHSS